MPYDRRRCVCEFYLFFLSVVITCAAPVCFGIAVNFRFRSANNAIKRAGGFYSVWLVLNFSLSLSLLLPNTHTHIQTRTGILCVRITILFERLFFFFVCACAFSFHTHSATGVCVALWWAFFRAAYSRVDYHFFQILFKNNCVRSHVYWLRC